MFEALAKEIEHLRVPMDGDAIAEILGLRDRLDAIISEAIGAFDRAELWDLDGATSMTSWLRDRARQTGRDAKRAAGTARRLSKLGATSDAWRDGTLSSGQVAAIVANLSERTVEMFAGHETELLPALRELPVAELAIAMQVWRQRAEALLDDPASAERVCSLHLSETLDGRYAIDGELDPEGGALLATALRLAESPDVDGEPVRSPSHRRADSLVDVCRFYLDHQQDRRGGRHRPHLNALVDLDDVASGGRVVGGPHLDGATIQRILCDAGLHRVVTDGRSTILDYGATTRTVPANLFSALVVRDRHCRFPGCDRPAKWCEGHHVVHWLRGGPTTLRNLVLLCSRHHHRCHQRGWEAKLLPDGELHVTTPDGRDLVSELPP